MLDGFCPCKLVSSWILTSRQPHSVFSGQITQSDFFLHQFRTHVTKSPDCLIRCYNIHVSKSPDCLIRCYNIQTQKGSKERLFIVTRTHNDKNQSSIYLSQCQCMSLNHKIHYYNSNSLLQRQKPIICLSVSAQ